MKTAFFALLTTSLVSSGLFITAPAAAQNNMVDKRVERLEKEMRAVQRKVFPGSDGKFFEPDIKPDATGPVTPSNTTSAVSDLITRVDALERSLANLTGQVEQNGFRLKQLEDKMAGGNNISGSGTGGNASQSNSTGNANAASASTAPSTASTTTQAAPKPERVAGVASIVMPATGDDGEDAYIYGYRLWEAGYFPEAQTQLKKAYADHPKHRRASFAQNLLGRAYLDDGKPALASVALYESYQKLPRGERAPDSLYFLSTALLQLGKKDDACRVLAELQDVYPGEASGRLSDRVASGKKAANCK